MTYKLAAIAQYILIDYSHVRIQSAKTKFYTIYGHKKFIKENSQIEANVSHIWLLHKTLHVKHIQNITKELLAAFLKLTLVFERGKKKTDSKLSSGLDFLHINIL